MYVKLHLSWIVISYADPITFIDSQNVSIWFHKYTIEKQVFNLQIRIVF